MPVWLFFSSIQTYIYYLRLFILRLHVSKLLHIQKGYRFITNFENVTQFDVYTKQVKRNSNYGVYADILKKRKVLYCEMVYLWYIQSTCLSKLFEYLQYPNVKGPVNSKISII